MEPTVACRLKPEHAQALLKNDTHAHKMSYIFRPGENEVDTFKVLEEIVTTSSVTPSNAIHQEREMRHLPGKHKLGELSLPSLPRKKCQRELFKPN